jgi:hypothetical protein
MPGLSLGLSLPCGSSLLPYGMGFSSFLLAPRFVDSSHRAGRFPPLVNRPIGCQHLVCAN